MVELDEKVVEVNRKFFPVGEVADREIKSGRFDLVFDSGATYMENLIKEGKSN